MEHMVNFGIVLDDDAIRAQVEQNITAQVSADILKQLDDNPGDLPTKTTRYGYLHRDTNKEVDWCKLVKVSVEEIAEEWKGDVVERAAEMLFESLRRSKKWKDRIEGIFEEGA